MYYGIPTLIEFENLDECAAFASSLSLHFVKISMDLPLYQYDKLNCDYINKLKEKYGVFFTVHLPAFLNISDFNSLVKEAWFETVKEVISFAKETESPIINMHLNKGDYFTLPEGKVNLFDKYEDYYLESVREFISFCEREIGERDIKITVENTGEFTSFQKKALGLFLKSKVFGLCFDIGHDHKNGNKDENFILKNENKLYHMHFHDSVSWEGNKKDHLPPLCGENDLNKYLYLANRLDLKVLLEVKTKEGIERAVNYLIDTPLPLI